MPANVPLGGVDSPEKLQPQQATNPLVRMAQLWAPPERRERIAVKAVCYHIGRLMILRNDCPTAAPLSCCQERQQGECADCGRAPSSFHSLEPSALSERRSLAVSRTR